MDDMTEEGARSLIASILDKALADAMSRDKHADTEGARRFINSENPLFCFYCELIDLDSDCVAEKMWKQIKQYDTDIERNRNCIERNRNCIRDFLNENTSRV